MSTPKTGPGELSEESTVPIRAQDRSGPGDVALHGAFVKLSPGSSGPAPGTLNVKCVSSLQVTLPTMGAPWSWAKVRRPFPEVIFPWICRS